MQYVKDGLCVTIASTLWLIALTVVATAQPDLLQQAINYVFTGTTEPEEVPQITDRNSCIVVLHNPKYPRVIRYYFGRMNLEVPRISKKYAGIRTLYELDVESENIIIEYLRENENSVIEGFRSEQIPFSGDANQTQKAIRIIAETCKTEKSKTPF